MRKLIITSNGSTAYGTTTCYEDGIYITCPITDGLCEDRCAFFTVKDNFVTCKGHIIGELITHDEHHRRLANDKTNTN